jgi:D-amino-acid dehydrogenase
VLAERAAQRGVVFRYDTPLSGLASDGTAVRGVHLANGEVLSAEAVVVALGSFTPRYLAPLGIDVPVYPAKGYSISIPLEGGVPAPTVSLIDDGAKIVFSRLGQRLRVAGTAEFAGYDTRIAPQRIAPLVRRVREIFPQLRFDESTIEPWAGLRPATPGNVPIIGPTRLKNLYLNTGHGTLGWTLAVGSGRLLADLLAGQVPAFDPSPYQP